MHVDSKSHGGLPSLASARPILFPEWRWHEKPRVFRAPEYFFALPGRVGGANLGDASRSIGTRGFGSDPAAVLQGGIAAYAGPWERLSLEKTSRLIPRLPSRTNPEQGIAETPDHALYGFITGDRFSLQKSPDSVRDILGQSVGQNLLVACAG